jgi:hypothetical protein
MVLILPMAFQHRETETPPPPSSDHVPGSIMNGGHIVKRARIGPWCVRMPLERRRKLPSRLPRIWSPIPCPRSPSSKRHFGLPQSTGETVKEAARKSRRSWENSPWTSGWPRAAARGALCCQLDQHGLLGLIVASLPLSLYLVLDFAIKRVLFR